MKRREVWATLLCLAALAILALAAAPAQAVVRGQHDPGDKYPNVGVIWIESESGAIFGSCTLVSEDLVVTAVHVVWDAYNSANPGSMAEGVHGRVSFDPDAVPWDPESALWIDVAGVDLPPTFVWPPATSPPSMQANFGPGWEDVAIAKLSTAVSVIEPATVPDENGLGGVDLKRATFSMAGYGIAGMYRGSLASAGRNPQLQILFDGRNYKESVRLLSDNWLYSDRFLMLSSCVCFGDSGGPIFYGTTVVAENTFMNGWTGDAPAYSYRLDTVASQTLLHKWLPEESFVTLN